MEDFYLYLSNISSVKALFLFKYSIFVLCPPLVTMLMRHDMGEAQKSYKQRINCADNQLFNHYQPIFTLKKVSGWRCSLECDEVGGIGTKSALLTLLVVFTWQQQEFYDLSLLHPKECFLIALSCDPPFYTWVRRTQNIAFSYHSLIKFALLPMHVLAHWAQ